MTQLLALSFDAPTSPGIRLLGAERLDASPDATYGWGLAWYPMDEPAASVVKDPTSSGQRALTAVISDWERFSSTVFVGHLRGAAKRRTLQDTHPFRRSHAGRDWVLAHNGDLRHGFREALPLGDAPSFEPLGRTDSEHAFCWLLERIREVRGRRLRDVGYERVLGWLHHINRLGTLNLLLSDGVDLLIYSDAWGYKPLSWTRHCPPHAPIHVRTEELELELGSSADSARTALIVSTHPLSDEGWQPVAPGTLLVARRGDVVFQGGASGQPWQAPPGLTHEESEGLGQGQVAAARRLSVVLHEAAPEVPLPFAGPFVPPTAPHEGPLSALRRAAEAIGAPEVWQAGLAHESDDDGDALATRVVETVHETIYAYTEPVELSAHMFRLRPVHDLGQSLLHHELTVQPGGPRRSFEDVFGNHVTEMTVRGSYLRLHIVARSIVRLEGRREPRLRAAPRQARLPLVWMPWQRQMMLPYLLPPELPETQLRELSDWAMSFAERQDGDLVETLKDINRTLYRDFAYRAQSTHLATTPWDVFVQREGVCQDFANLFICLARLLSIPARYRVGYIFTGGQYAENTRQGDESHAWVEVYLPSMGWRGLDPTNGTLVGLDHVRVACGRNYVDAAPTGGTLYRGGAGETLVVRVTVADVTGTGRWGGDSI